jgi:aminoglycoside 3-N-acetyltransferase I
MSPAPTPHVVRRLGATDLATARALNALFAAAFEDAETYAGAPPADAWLASVLGQPHVIALVALDGETVVGGLVAYELDKLERARREIYIYDLAVAATHRRRGIATALVEAVRGIAAERDAWVVYVQADYVDPPAIALYERLGVREEVLHFDIPVAPGGR